MNYLELVKSLSVEAGIGPGPSTVIGQIGEYLRVKGWIDKAYEEIQGVHENWNFLRKDATISATPTITNPTDFGSWKRKSFRCYDTTTGTDDEQFIEDVEWEIFRDSYLYGPARSQTGRPTTITVRPDNVLVTWPVSDGSYTVTGEYYASPDVMVSDVDIPIFPMHHLAIVWKGLMLYARYSSEPDKYAADQYKPLLRKLELSQLPKMSFGAPLV